MAPQPLFAVASEVLTVRSGALIAVGAFDRSANTKNKLITNSHYTLPYSEQQRLRDRAYRAQQRDQSEVCGVLLANAERLLRFHFMTNAAEEPGVWALDRLDLIKVRRSYSTTEWDVVGTFHSHPISEAIPGPRDFASLSVHQLQLIYDVCGRQSRLWTRTSMANGTAPRELELRITKKPNKPVDATASSSVVTATSTAPTHHL